MQTPQNDISGHRFGNVIALSISHYIPRMGTYWLCLCDCGRKFTTQRSNLRFGRTKSCGCSRKGCAGRPRTAKAKMRPPPKPVTPRPATEVQCKLQPVFASDLAVRKSVKAMHLPGSMQDAAQVQPFVNPDDSLWIRTRNSDGKYTQISA